MAGYVPWQAAAPPAGHAFPTIPGYGLRNARILNTITSRGINQSYSPNTFRRNNRPALTRLAADFTGVHPAHISTRQAPDGSVYIQATHPPHVAGWGGEPAVTTHFSGHGPGGKIAPIGQFHSRTTVGPAGNSPLVYEARSIPYRGNFSMLATPAGSVNAGRAYPAGSFAANVARGLGATYSRFAAAHPVRPPYGGRKTRKHTKRAKKGKSRKH